VSEPVPIVAEPGNAEPGNAEPGNAEPGNAEPGNAEPAVDRDLVVVLHPERPLVLTGGDVGDAVVEVTVDDPPANWPELLSATRQVVPDGAWPLGPSRRLPGLWLHVVTARTTSVPAGYQWSEVPDAQWSASVRGAVTAALDEDANRIPTHSLRSPWMQRGWWEEATAWVDARLADAGRRRTGDLEPKEHWGVSAVARVPATGGALWLKAVPPTFAREPAVIAVLGERLPGLVPVVFACAEEAGGGPRFLTEDAGHVPDDVVDDDLPRLAALIADLQVRTVDLLPQLAAAGCVDRSPARLAAELARMAEDGFEIDLLTADERAVLSGLVPEISDRLRALSDGPLPTVLVHGDFHAWNVTRTAGWSDGDAVVIDWTDAAIGPAGVDLTTLLREGVSKASRAEVMLAYSTVWAEHLDLPMAEVEAAVAATETAADVVQALAYDEILRVLEPEARPPLAGVMAQRLRALIATKA
jgi:aminoglycoside phosphotransferase (APT) family kinase protein